MRGFITPYQDGWRVWVEGGRDPITGRRRRLSRTVRGTKKDAERVLTALQAEVDRGAPQQSNVRTLGEVLDAFMSHKTLSLEATSAAGYRMSLTYFPDRLKQLPVHKLTVEHVEAFYAYLATRGSRRTGGPLSSKTIRNVNGVLHGALELARRRGWIKTNPAADAEKPTSPRRLPTPAPAGSVGELLAAAASIDPALALYIRLSLILGGRRSEVHGLRWSGVDFGRSRVTLRDVVVRAGPDLIVKPRLKAGGSRTVHLDPTTLDMLRRHHQEAFEVAMAAGAVLRTDAFVFSASVDGSEHWRPETTSRRFQRACVAAGLPPSTRLHDLRHLAATWLLDQGVPLPAVSARLGHATNSVTLDVYGARVDHTDVIAADVMSRLFEAPAGDPDER